MMAIWSKKKIIRRIGTEEAAKETEVKLSRYLFYVLAGLFLAVLVHAFLFSAFLEVRNIEIGGNHSIPDEILLQEVERMKDGKYFGVVPRNNLILIRSDEIAARMTGSFKKISQVEVEKGFPDTLRIRVQEREVLLIWCSREDCFLVDEKGMAYSRADFSSPEAVQNNLLIIRDESGSEVVMGSLIADPKLVDFLMTFRERAAGQAGIKIGREFQTPSPISGDLVGETEEGWRILLNSSLGADEGVKMLAVLLDQSIPEGKRSALEYVDLRTAGKVYFKFKKTEGENLPEEDQS